MEETSTEVETMPLKRDLPSKAAGQEIMVQDTSTGKVHFLNPTAAIIWRLCDGTTTRGECEVQLREKFELPIDHDLSADISQTVLTFLSCGLLV